MQKPSSMKDLLSGYASMQKKRNHDEKHQKVGTSSQKKTRYSDVTSPSTGISTKESASNPTIVESHEGLPNFLIIGAQKAGTMAAVKNLNKHPDVLCLSEEHFFDLAWHSKTVNSYKALFKKGWMDKKLLGEKTPEYSYVDECHSRIRTVCGPSTKFIFMIRDPIKRAYSAWNMNIKRDFEVNLFDDCVDTNLKNLNEYRSYGTAEYHYVQRGFYLDEINRFLKTFPNRDNLLIVVAEHIQKNPEVEYDRIFDFLGLRRTLLTFENDHVGSYTTPINEKIAEKLRKVYEPHNERLFKFLGYRISEWETTKKVSPSQEGLKSIEDPEKV